RAGIARQGHRVLGQDVVADEGGAQATRTEVPGVARAEVEAFTLVHADVAGEVADVAGARVRGQADPQVVVAEAAVTMDAVAVQALLHAQDLDVVVADAADRVFDL